MLGVLTIILKSCQRAFFIQQGGVSVVWLTHISERQRRWVKNARWPFGLPLQCRQTTLFVAHLEPPNFSSLALSGGIEGATGLPK